MENEHFACLGVTDSGPGSGLQSIVADSSILARKYEYRRRMPHYQTPGYPIFVTFCKLIRDPLPDAGRDLVLAHCLHDNGKRVDLRAVVVMPDHVHLLLTPLPDEDGWPHPLPAILKLIKGISARSVNKFAGNLRPGLAGGVLRAHTAQRRKFQREAGVHPPEPSAQRPGSQARRLSLALGRA